MKKSKLKHKKKQYRIKILLILAIGIFQNGNAQTVDELIESIIPTPKVPTHTTFQQPNIVNITTRNNQPKSLNVYNPNLSIQQRNALLIQQADRQIENRRIQSRKLVQEAISGFENPSGNINYNLPSKANQKGTEHYRKAFQELSAMNENDFSIKKATFIIENAFYENKKDYDRFKTYIKNAGDFIKQAIKEQKLDEDNNIVKNLNIYQFISDTLSANGIKHKPFKYDFNDYFGKKDWSKMFVDKLIFEGSGQCNSMPRYYLILAEELNAKSFLAYAPNHSFIKFQDLKGDWYNAELTSGALLTDAFLVSSGFVKAEAIYNGSYAEPQTSKQLMSQLFTDLASGYINKYGYDEFTKKVIDKSIELNPNGISGNLHKFNQLLKNMEYVAKKLQIQQKSQLQQYPQAFNLYKKLEKQDQQIKNIGYERISKEDYEEWIKSMSEEKKEQAKENKELLLQSTKLKQFKN